MAIDSPFPRLSGYGERAIRRGPMRSSMSAPAATWIELGRLAAARLGGIARTERQAVFASVAQERGVNATYVRRATAAYEYVSGKAAAVGVDLNEIAASVSIVELLRRLGKASPDEAAVQTRRILLGDVSFGSLQSLCRMVEAAAREVDGDDAGILNLDRVATSIEEDLGKATPLVRAKALSPMARAVHADMEFADPTRDARSNVVVILAPGWRRRLSRPTADEACAAILAASLCFAKTYYVAIDAAECKSRRDSLGATLIDMQRVKFLVPDCSTKSAKPRAAPLTRSRRGGVCRSQ